MKAAKETKDTTETSEATGTNEASNDDNSGYKTVYKLVQIDGDGECTLQAYDDFGELVDKKEQKKVEGAVFLSSYKLSEKKYKFLTEYKGTDVQHQQDILKDVEAFRVKDAMVTLALQEMKDYPLTIRTSPTKGVFCKEDIANIVLCPYQVWPPC